MGLAAQLGGGVDEGQGAGGFLIAVGNASLNESGAPQRDQPRDRGGFAVQRVGEGDSPAEPPAAMAAYVTRALSREPA
jgi:hypothetical protein